MRSSIMLKVSASLIAAVLAVASSATTAQAQDSGFTARMAVPFAFQTASGHFGPGVYTISLNGPHTMIIRSNTTAGLALTQLVNDEVPATKGKAVFTHYGDQYFLRTVSLAGSASHLSCGKSKAERASQIAARKAPGGVEIALLPSGR